MEIKEKEEKKVAVDYLFLCYILQSPQIPNTFIPYIFLKNSQLHLPSKKLKEATKE